MRIFLASTRNVVRLPKFSTRQHVAEILTASAGLPASSVISQRDVLVISADAMMMRLPSVAGVSAAMTGSPVRKKVARKGPQGRDGFRKDRPFVEEASPVVPVEVNAAESFVAEPVAKPTRAPKPAAGEGDKAARKAKVQKAIKLSKSKGGAKASGKTASKASAKAPKAVKPAKPSAKPVKRAAKSGSKAKKA